MWRYIAFGCLALLVLTHTAHAQQAVPLNDMVNTFETQARGWSASLTTIGRDIFAVLATIEFSMAMIRLLTGRPDMSEVVAALINEILYLGFFYWVMSTPQLGMDIIDSFRLAANQAGGVQTMSPGDILAIGVNLAGTILNSLSVWSPAGSGVLILAGLAILVCFAYVTVEMVVALVEVYFVVGTSVLFMAFGGSRWTKDVAIGVIRHLFGLGTRVFFLQLIAATAWNMAQGWIPMVATMQVRDMLLIVGCSIVVAGIAWQVPKSMERMVSGSSSSSGAAMLAGAAAAVAPAVAGAAIGARAAQVISGAGAAAGQSVRLASEQASSQGGTSSGARYAMAVAGGAAKNMASAALTDLGRGLSGQRTSAGSAPWRMAADMGNQRRLLAEDSNRPAPPPPPSNTISGTTP